MDNATTPTRVEPLMYQPIAGNDVWPRLINAVALAMALAGASMVGTAVSDLWFYGFFGASSAGVFAGAWFEYVLIVFPTLGVGIAFLTAAILMFGKAERGIGVARVALYCLIITSIFQDVVGISLLAIRGAGLSSPMRRYQIVLELSSVFMQLSLPLLLLAILRIYLRAVAYRVSE
jgi:hypothetical protein